MTPSIGDKIIAAINKDRLLHELVFNGGNLDYVWKPSTAEQLEAVVEAHIEERVRIRLELDRQAILDKSAARHRLCRTCGQKWKPDTNNAICPVCESTDTHRYHPTE